MSIDFLYNAQRDREHDPESRRHAIPFLSTVFGQQFGDNPATKHPSGYKQPDLLSSDGQIFVELEHRNNWTQLRFNFPTVRVPVRKTWLCDNHDGYYCVLSADFQRFALRPLKGITTSPLQRRAFFNSEAKQHDFGQFYEIAASEFKFYILRNNYYELLA